MLYIPFASFSRLSLSPSCRLLFFVSFSLFSLFPRCFYLLQLGSSMLFDIIIVPGIGAPSPFLVVPSKLILGPGVRGPDMDPNPTPGAVTVDGSPYPPTLFCGHLEL